MKNIKECVVTDCRGVQIFNEGKAEMSMKILPDAFEIIRYIGKNKVVNIFPKRNVSSFFYILAEEDAA